MALTDQLTLDEFLLRPEEKPALEFEQGGITQKMAPLGWHGLLQGDLYFRFRMHGAPRTVVRAFSETRVTWTEEGISYVPDVIAYRAERVPTDPDGFISNHVTVPPDIAVEIWSPGQGLARQMDRCRWYIAHGVPISLLVHPERRAVWTFRPGAESGPLQGADIVDLDDVIPGFSFVVNDLFAVLRAHPD
jgi:Uma2 family endonuclease